MSKPKQKTIQHVGGQASKKKKRAHEHMHAGLNEKKHISRTTPKGKNTHFPHNPPRKKQNFGMDQAHMPPTWRVEPGSEF